MMNHWRLWSRMYNEKNVENTWKNFGCYTEEFNVGCQAYCNRFTTWFKNNSRLTWLFSKITIISSLSFLLTSFNFSTYYPNFCWSMFMYFVSEFSKSFLVCGQCWSAQYLMIGRKTVKKKKNISLYFTSFIASNLQTIMNIFHYHCISAPIFGRQISFYCTAKWQ